MNVAASRRRLGELDLAALALEEAIELGAAADLAGGELAALLAFDPGDPGAYRALHSFTRIRPSRAAGPFPLGTAILAGDLLARRAALFRAVFRQLGEKTTVALAKSLGKIVSGPSRETEARRWSATLARKVSKKEARALDRLYGTLLGCARRRVTVAPESPASTIEVLAERLPVNATLVDLALHEMEELRNELAVEALLLLNERRGGFKVRQGPLLRTFGGHMVHDEYVGPGTAVSEPTRLDIQPLSEGNRISFADRLVLGDDAAFTLGVDGAGEAHVVRVPYIAHNMGADLGHDVGKGTVLGAACGVERDIAIFLSPGCRAYKVTRGAHVSRERRLGPGLEPVSAVSREGTVVLLARSSTAAFLVKLGTNLAPIDEPVQLPGARMLRDARVEWPDPEHLVVIEPPDVAHVVRATDLVREWRVTIPEPLDDLCSTFAFGNLELLAHGVIESEFGAPGAAVGLARWTADGLGRRGPTTRLDPEPGSLVTDRVRVACSRHHVAVAFQEEGRSELSLRMLVLSPEEVSSPPPSEWTYDRAGEPPEPDDASAAGAGGA